MSLSLLMYMSSSTPSTTKVSGALNRYSRNLNLVIPAKHGANLLAHSQNVYPIGVINKRCSYLVVKGVKC